MSFLPFICVLCSFLLGLAQGTPDFKGAEALMQIQRVLELSSEIAQAEDVSLSDITAAESKYTKKRQYALPDELLQLVNNHISDLNSQQVSQRPKEQQANFVTPAPDKTVLVQSEETGNYAVAAYQSNPPQYQQQEQQQYQQQYQQQSGQSEYGAPESQQYAISQEQAQQYAIPQEQAQQYAIPQDQAQQYALQDNQQYTLQQQSQAFTLQQQSKQYAIQEQNQQYALAQGQSQQYAGQPHYVVAQDPQQVQVYKQPENAQYSIPAAHSYAAVYGQTPTQVAAVVATPDPAYQSQSQLYGGNPRQHFVVAAHQAQLTQTQKPQQTVYYVPSSHSQAGSYTQAIIGPNPQQYPTSPAQSLSAPKAPVQINIHPHQAYDLLNNYRGTDRGQSGYMPLQILINQLAEPLKYAQPGISPQGGPQQPKMPVYHYSPVPSGVIKDEHIPEMRIKSTHTPPNPHSDKYKDYPSSPASSSSLSMPPSSSYASQSQSQTPSHHRQPPTASKAEQSGVDWDDDEFIKYDFGYRVSDETHKLEFGKTETKKDGVTKGSYHVLLPDGRLQVVKYWSDHTGYHTDISYSVPGVDGKK